MRAEVARREEMQTKIRMILEANGTPMTVKEIREHPTMSGVSGQKVGNNLLHMTGTKMGKGKRWAIVGKKTKVTRAKRVAKRGPYKKVTVAVEEQGSSGAQFRITREGKLLLSINGVSFPVEIE